MFFLPTTKGTSAVWWTSTFPELSAPAQECKARGEPVKPAQVSPEKDYIHYSVFSYAYISLIYIYIFFFQETGLCLFGSESMEFYLCNLNTRNPVAGSNTKACFF